MRAYDNDFFIPTTLFMSLAKHMTTLRTFKAKLISLTVKFSTKFMQSRGNMSGLTSIS